MKAPLENVRESSRVTCEHTTSAHGDAHVGGSKIPWTPHLLSLRHLTQLPSSPPNPPPMYSTKALAEEEEEEEEEEELKEEDGGKGEGGEAAVNGRLYWVNYT
ncbi:hypothetical protein E2C01_014041 [Portunus trituberculatus]|uniref:Uncharacterized protein n=1 Tax=Portunus trituberculatus TaxID=210409 RepID=A0A5B7DI40_PORTR|nr:hypothetical protein [Portunus trituberculatus]